MGKKAIVSKISGFILPDFTTANEKVLLLILIIEMGMI